MASFHGSTLIGLISLTHDNIEKLQYYAMGLVYVVSFIERFFVAEDDNLSTKDTLKFFTPTFIFGLQAKPASLQRYSEVLLKSCMQM